MLTYAVTVGPAGYRRVRGAYAPFRHSWPRPAFRRLQAARDPSRTLVDERASYSKLDGQQTGNGQQPSAVGGSEANPPPRPAAAARARAASDELPSATATSSSPSASNPAAPRRDRRPGVPPQQQQQQQRKRAPIAAVRTVPAPGQVRVLRLDAPRFRKQSHLRLLKSARPDTLIHTQSIYNPP